MRRRTVTSSLSALKSFLSWVMLQRWFFAFPLLAVTLSSWFALEPMFWPGIPNTHDLVHHLTRLVEFDSSIASGILYPRWAPDLGLSYGNPIFNFYPPLSYYMAE